MWWPRSGVNKERKTCRGGSEEGGISISDVLRTHLTQTTYWITIGRVRLGGPRAGYSPVVIQQVGDSHQVVGEHGGAHQEFEMRASFEVASLHPAAAEQHRDAALNAGAESLSLLELFTAL